MSIDDRYLLSLDPTTASLTVKGVLVDNTLDNASYLGEWGLWAVRINTPAFRTDLIRNIGTVAAT